MFRYYTQLNSKVQATKNRTLSKHSFDENRVFLLSSMLSGDTSEIDKITLVKVFLMEKPELYEQFTSLWASFRQSNVGKASRQTETVRGRE